MQNPHKENMDNCGTNMCSLQGFNISSIPYRDKLLALLKCWDGLNHPISIFGTREILIVDNNNIVKFFLKIVKYVKYNKLLNNNEEDIPAIADFGHVA